MARVVGIDWATEPKNRAMVALEVSGDGSLAYAGLTIAPNDSVTAATCVDTSVAVVAVDIPFAWPAKFAEFVSTWRPTGAAPPPTPGDFRYRVTDAVVKSEAPRNPLSVSADRFAMGARAWAGVVAANSLGPRIDVVGTLHERGPTLIEVYPAATLASTIEWRESYKREPSTRRDVLHRLGDKFGVPTAPHEDEIVGTGKDSDILDAFIAALTGAIYLQDARNIVASHAFTTRVPSEREIGAATREGWIFFPVKKQAETTRDRA